MAQNSEGLTELPEQSSAQIDPNQSKPISVHSNGSNEVYDQYD